MGDPIPKVFLPWDSSAVALELRENIFLVEQPFLLQHFNQCRYFPHAADGEFFEGDEVFGGEGLSHKGYAFYIVCPKNRSSRTLTFSNNHTEQ